jgi:hypothetical protein
VRKLKRRLLPTRFSVHTPVRYRTADGGWYSGITESISTSEMLLRGDEPLEPDTAVEMEVQLPAVRGEGAARVICRGRIVSRDVLPDAIESSIVMAATIARYRIDR